VGHAQISLGKDSIGRYGLTARAWLVTEHRNHANDE